MARLMGLRKPPMSSGDRPAGGERGQRPLLELRGVQKRYGRTLAVESLDLVLYEGEILTLLGHSGCGKTTTLRMIMGLERCTVGEILHEGRVVDAPVQRKFVPPHKRNMGIVFQSYALWPHMSVFDNVAYPLKVRGIRRGEIRERVMKTLDLVGLADYAKRAPSQLSGGQQQRVALARSIVYEPKLLLLDEPFSNLDAKLREQMRAELKGLQAELGLTVVFVTHDQTEALSISDRIVMMHEGRVEQSGSPLELYSRPSTEVVRDFLGSSIIFDGKVVDRRQSHHFGVAIQPTGNRVVEAYSNGSSDRIAIGDPCRISVRPEHLRVRGSSTAQACDIPAIIQRLLFCGDRYEAVLEFQDGRRGSVYLEADRTWKEGEAVTVGIANGSAILWPGTVHTEAGFGESED